ncbi:hypothetical protein K435DRAFT_716149 [Dendrothele bispora CBS 962.96]|uniref:Uncharacterized protein n=1 Tax=Dendrothele bispora (strain CBS 962.96) TaxID=1314807 RepID=A0A4S8MLC6_DENBC|nr:hypothetical protein K435DRAFT_716149 [Dendrothele bispora CBS 962.96]
MMASAIASSSTAPSTSSFNSPLEESRPQAGPLPSKRGEIGYQEELHESSEEGSSSTSEHVALPERHPADRDHPPAAPEASSPSPESSAAATTDTPSNPPSDDSSSTSSIKKSKNRFLHCFLHSKKTVKYGGIKLTTLLAFSFQMLAVSGTIAGWIVAALMLNGKNIQSQSTDSNGNNAPQSSISSSIFIHVVFAIAFLGQLLFLERRVFIMRAQRYAYLHPGEILPSSRRTGRTAGNGIGIAPWNRPPLPTYARALQESGIGTGDVEDNEIAMVPPPAYGNTRGSRLLLTGYLRQSLRVQRPPSVHTVASSRPVSYASRDEDWEIIQDADRARQLEETLTTLEGPQSRRQ